MSSRRIDYRLSGVHQPSTCQFLSGTVELSDDRLDRLLSCMGHRLEVTRRPVVPELTRSERRSWRLPIRLTPASLKEWRPVIGRNIERLRGSVTGQSHRKPEQRQRSGQLSETGWLLELFLVSTLTLLARARHRCLLAHRVSLFSRSSCLSCWARN